MLKTWSKVNWKFKTAFLQRIYSKNPPPFHIYSLVKLEACSEPRQTPKMDLFRGITLRIFTLIKMNNHFFWKLLEENSLFLL